MQRAGVYARTFSGRAAPPGGPCRWPSWAARRRTRAARVLVGRGLRPTCSCSSRASAVGRLVAVAQHDHRAHDGAALRVGRRDHRRLGHRRVLDQRRLDLERPDPVAGGDDHVVGAALEVQVAVVVLRDAVAGAPGRGAVGAARPGSRGRKSGPCAGRRPARRRDLQAHAGQRRGPSSRGGPARRAACRSAGRSRSGRSRRGSTRRSPLPLAQHLGVQRLAGGDQPRRRAAAAACARLAITRYSVGAMHSTSTRSRSSSSRRSSGSKRPSWSSAAAPRSHGGDEHVARRLRPAAGRRAPDELARPRAEPVLGLQRWPGR